MEQVKINRINELAAAAKLRTLTEKETEERAALRQEYIESVRANLKQTLDNCVIMDENGEKHRIMSK